MAKLSQSGIFGSTKGQSSGGKLNRSFFGGGLLGGSSSSFGGRGQISIRPQQSIFDQNQDVLIQNNQTSVVSLQEQVNNLQLQLVQINSGLKNIFDLLILESSQDKLQLLAEQERERKLLTRQFRTDQETILERKITSSLQKPLEKIENSVGGLFNRIGQALGFLFLGWLSKQGIAALIAAEEGDKDKLEQIKQNVQQKVTRAIFLVGAIWRSFNKLIGALKKLTRLAVKGLFSLGKLILFDLPRLGLKAFGTGFKFGRALISKLFGKTSDPALKSVEKVGQEITEKGTVRGGGGLFSRMFGRGGTEVAQTAGQKAGQKVGQKAAGGIFRFLPWVGTFFDWNDAIRAFMRGNKEAASAYAIGGALNLFPMVWTQALSAGFTASGVALEVNEIYENLKKEIDAEGVKFDIDKTFNSLPLLDDLQPEIIEIETPSNNNNVSVDPTPSELTNAPNIATLDRDNIWTGISESLYNAYA